MPVKSSIKTQTAGQDTHLCHAFVAGTGRAVPKLTMTSAQMDEKLGLASGTLERKTGVETRYVCETEDQIELATTACRNALKDAGRKPGDVDLVLGACSVPYQTIPSTAPRVMAELGIADGRAAAYDVNSTCLSFLNAVNVAAKMIGAGQNRCVLVVSSEIASRALPWDTDPDTAALFGDGAAAAVIEAAKVPGLGPMLMRTYPSVYEASALKAGGTRLDFHTDPESFARGARFEMDGGALFRVTAKHFGRFVDDLLDGYGWQKDEIDCIVPHQASPAALEHMIRHTGFARDRVIDITKSHGNQIAASIPFALDMARRDGRITKGQKVLMLGTSAGVSFGGLGYVA